ncbi:MAG: ABC transporter permease [Gemmatimonadetes bacterium]|nr:ABC transporter permease [Gemmatimonadota bacterium]NNL30070.1 ABC transporter permease [Gemmatimonadota bacterium]
MSPLRTLLARQFRDLLRTRAVAGYALFVALATWGLLQFGGGAERALPSLATLVVLVVPLVSVLITTTYLYHSGDFIELILSQPVGRRPLFTSLYLGLVVTLVGAFFLGVLAPFLAVGLTEGVRGLMILVVAGAFLTAIFVSLGFFVAFRVADPARGNGVALLVWLALAVLYDGGVLYAAYRWAAYPLETPMLLLMALNPVDVARVLLIMGLDASAMMGYTGAVFQDFFGGGWGMVMAISCLTLWVVVPALGALRVFVRKDF